MSVLPGRASARDPALLREARAPASPTRRWPAAIASPARFWTLAAFLLVVGSASSAPLGTIGGLTVTGDRVLGAAAVVALVTLAARLRRGWTAVHSALAAFVAAQVLTTALQVPSWPQGPKFVTIYVLGFACYAVAAECARGLPGRRWLTRTWIGLAAALSVAGTIAATLSNAYQRPFWGSGGAQPLFRYTEHERTLFAARVTFNEWNLFSSFLLIPFALALWAWRRDVAGRWPPVAVLAAIVFGLVNGVTRAAWLSALAIVALWWWTRRPRPRQLAALAGMAGAALLLQAVCLGTTPLWARLFEQRSNLDHRMLINRITVESWLDLAPVAGPPAPDAASASEGATTPAAAGPETARPGRASLLTTARHVALGHGAGSVNRLSVVLPIAGRVSRIWNGNVVLFVLHDSGVLGLGALVALVVVVARRARRALAGRPEESSAVLIVPLLASGAALGFAYQFTHGLWLMYPYVYLGFLTTVLEGSEGD
jgi:hypothetical protein